MPSRFVRGLFAAAALLCGAAPARAAIFEPLFMVTKVVGEVRIENLSDEEAAAIKLVPERLIVGQPFCLSRVPYAERRKIMMPRLLWSLFDGQRNLLQCVRIHDGEVRTRATPEFIGRVMDSLRYLEKYGYVRLR